MIRRPPRSTLLSLHAALPISLENARVVRVLTGFGATNSSRSIYDPAISNTVIDQEQARFDPAFNNRFTWKDRKSTRLNSSHANISYAVFCLKKKINLKINIPT